MMKNIYIDCDGVLLDWVTPFYTWMREEHEMVFRTLSEYDLTKTFSLTKKGALKYVQEFAETDAFSKLLPYPDAKYVLNRLGVPFDVITACGKSDKIMEARECNLSEHFVHLGNIHFVDSGYSKKDIFNDATKAGDMVIEDSIEHAACIENRDMYLIDRAWNRTVVGGPYKAVNSFLEIDFNGC